MGGNKCNYRDCTQKNDGVIHLFRYPVFDKVRCHKWMRNARRMELLNLKVSQVKNKQICQYHFRDEDFMNRKKMSLKPLAIPTLNGPFCKDDTMVECDDKFDPIKELIENECLSIKDLRSLSFLGDIKFSDYLMNSDAETLQHKPPQDTPEQTQIEITVPPLEYNQIQIKPVTTKKLKTTDANKRVKILSEKRLLPIESVGAIEIEIQHNTPGCQAPPTSDKENSLLKEINSEPVHVQKESLIKQEHAAPAPPSKEKKIEIPVVTTSEPLTSQRLLKETAKNAAIQEKRKFNMKLRDIITKTINNIDQPQITKSSNQEPVKSNRVIMDLPISELERKINNLEKLLLCRIDATTKEVHDLKKTLDEKLRREEEQEQKEKSAQKLEHPEVKKKRLYNEISEFLSQEGKNSLYEELFVSKFSKRKRRL